MFNSVEPMIPLATLRADARAIAARIVATRGASKGRIKTTRPSDDDAYYVWRMVRFYVSPDPRASCMPVAAAYVLPHARFEHDTACPRSPKHYASLDAAYARGTGVYNMEGNYRCDCSCGASDRQTVADKESKDHQKRLDGIVDEIVQVVPPHQRYGQRRWTRAMHGVDPYNSGDVLDPANHSVVDARDELAGVLL